MLLLGLKSTYQTLINKRVLCCVNFRLFFFKRAFFSFRTKQIFGHCVGFLCSKCICDNSFINAHKMSHAWLNVLGTAVGERGSRSYACNLALSQKASLLSFLTAEALIKAQPENYTLYTLYKCLRQFYSLFTFLFTACSL